MCGIHNNTSMKRESSFMFSVCGNDVDLLVESACLFGSCLSVTHPLWPGCCDDYCFTYDVYTLYIVFKGMQVNVLIGYVP